VVDREPAPVTGLITLRRPIVATPDPDPLSFLASSLPAVLPQLDEDGQPHGWSFRQATGLRFAKWRAARGDFDGDRFGLRPEPLPPIVAETRASDHDDDVREGWR
jgi:hypothetical protein